jgi:8-oxo-dGTP pyrophosphatase MutT (NUDIX family)
VFAAAFWAQLRYIHARERASKDELRAREPTHAGGVVYQKTQDDVEYLVAQAKSDQREWILPKGHIMGQEGHIEAALREIKEETGCWGRARGLLDRLRYVARGEKIDCKYYLIESIYQGSKMEEREVKWLNLQDAHDQLEHDESRFVLLMAQEQLQKLGVIGQSGHAMESWAKGTHDS